MADMQRQLHVNLPFFISYSYDGARVIMTSDGLDDACLLASSSLNHVDPQDLIRSHRQLDKQLNQRLSIPKQFDAFEYVTYSFCCFVLFLLSLLFLLVLLIMCCFLYSRLRVRLC